MKPAFSHLNLWRNPFGELSLGEKAQLAIGSFDDYLDTLSNPGFALQILGDMGRGKTTYLLALRKRFPKAPYTYYPEDGPKPKVPLAPLLFLDEMQRFSCRERRLLLKRKASFVLASHQDHSQEFESLGLTYQSIILKGLSKDKLREILERRIEASRRAPGPLPHFDDAALEALLRRFGDDLRSTEDYLYEIFQTLPEISALKID